MCGVCGCGTGGIMPGRDDKAHGHNHHAHDHHHNDHQHDHGHGHAHGPQHAHAPGLSEARMVQIEQDILSANDAHAARNRRLLEERGVLALNLVSSPGAGKTTLLAATIEALRGEFPMHVIEGDQQTDNDARRIRDAGAPAVQINTGKGCHLDAHMVGHAIERLEPGYGDVLFIENVGNLVCPASFDLGETFRVVILSVTEGDDKPAKYPDMFHGADLMIVSKTDLLPHVDFDVERCVEQARRLNPRIGVVRLSASTGEGMEHWLRWIRAAREMKLAASAAPEASGKTGEASAATAAE